MKKLIAFAATGMLLFAGCKKDALDQAVTVDDQQDIQLSQQQIDDEIRRQFQEKGYFNWSDASDEMVWSAIRQSDHIASIGYKPTGEADIDKRIHAININDGRWLAVKQQLLGMIYEEERKLNPAIRPDKLEVWKEKNLPVINVKIESLKTVRMLRRSNLVRYAEPMGYDPIERFERSITPASSDGVFGCGAYAGDNSLVEGPDYTVVSPNAKVSWNYPLHGIPAAWAKSTGDNIKVMVIDSGVDPNQPNLGAEFNQGLSAGRTIEKIFTMPGDTNADDRCGHGTAMSGTVAAPRGIDGNAAGVAYNSDFVICRGASDVFLDASDEIKGVSDAYVWAGNNSSVKIISLSLGRITGSSQIKDAINYAYNRGKLMFCAGGTSFSFTSFFVGVIFPATLPNVLAITGVKEGTTLNKCDDCHKGRQIDYVIVMEKRGSLLHPLTTARSGDVPTTVGGSSVSTATAAGIAALVWSRFPTFTREQVINKLTTTSSAYPNKTSNFGWGILNADAATN